MGEILASAIELSNFETPLWNIFIEKQLGNL